MDSERDRLHDKIRETISNLRDEDLIHVVQSTSGEYTRFARDVARGEIERRGGEAALKRRLTEQMALKAVREAESITATRLKPLTGQIHTECYIEVWQDKNFEGESLIIKGPGEISDLCANHLTWCGRINSLRVGPRAFVLGYGARNFQGDVIRLGPGEEVPDLANVKFDDKIDSIRIIDSIKVFDCTLSDKNAISSSIEVATESDEEGSMGDETQSFGQRQNRRHKRRWR